MKYVAYALPAAVVMEYPEHTAWFPLIFGLMLGGGKQGKVMLDGIVSNDWALRSQAGVCTLALTPEVVMQTEYGARKKKEVFRNGTCNFCGGFACKGFAYKESLAILLFEEACLSLTQKMYRFYLSPCVRISYRMKYFCPRSMKGTQRCMYCV